MQNQTMNYHKNPSGAYLTQPYLTGLHRIIHTAICPNQPCRRIRALPCHALPCQSIPCHRILTAPYLAPPLLTRPDLNPPYYRIRTKPNIALPKSTQSNQTIPGIALPRNPNPTVPYRYHAEPKPTQPIPYNPNLSPSTLPRSPWRTARNRVNAPHTDRHTDLRSQTPWRL